MKLLALIVCTAFFAAVHGKRFEYKCIRLDVNGTVTVTAKNTKTNTTSPQTINLSTVTGTKTTGNCSNAQTAVMMNVAFSNTTSWKLAFTNDSGQVTLNQSVTFDPATIFKSCSATGSLTLSPAKSLPLSSSNASYLCESEETIDFSSKTEGDCIFSITQNITNIQVQAFGLPSGTYSPAEHCAGDQTTMVPTTEATTVPTPTEPVPVKKKSFVVKDTKGNVCFRLEAGLQLVVEYETTDKAMAYSKVIPVNNSKVNGTCAGSGNTATMVIEDNFRLNITETRSKDAAASDIKLDVTLDATNFPKALHFNKTVSFELNRTFEQSRADTFYVCDSEQTLKLKSENTTAMLYTNDVQMQAFNLKKGSFSGNGARCDLDPTPSPMPPASKPGDNQYVVRENASVVCLVLKGEISFSNVTYMKKSGMAQANPINIPAINETSGNVMYNGSCNLEKGSAQQLVIFFNRNWTLTLTFARGTSKDSSMLTVTGNEFTLHDIEFVYYMVPEFFPNATTPYVRVVANQTNITSDFMKGAVGGSYKCNAKQTEQLNNGIEVQTAKFQFKAFNSDNSTTFNNNVSECSADDESNSIVPIAVGAALAGLVAIVLIAYLIGRRRSRRQGYESV